MLLPLCHVLILTLNVLILSDFGPLSLFSTVRGQVVLHALMAKGKEAAASKQFCHQQLLQTRVAMCKRRWMDDGQGKGGGIYSAISNSFRRVWRCVAALDGRWICHPRVRVVRTQDSSRTSNDSLFYGLIIVVPAIRGIGVAGASYLGKLVGEI